MFMYVSLGVSLALTFRIIIFYFLIFDFVLFLFSLLFFLLPPWTFLQWPASLAALT